MSEYFRRFLRDYPGIANNPHVYTVDTEYEEIRGGGIKPARVISYSTITITRLDQ